MFKKIGLVVLISILLLFTACSTNNDSNMVGIDIQNISSGIGAVGGNVNDFETQSFSYTITLTNSEAADITIVSVNPVLTEKFSERVENKDTIIKVNKIIPGGSSLNVTGDIIFDAKGLTKEQIVNLQPFVKEVKVLEERTVNMSF